MTASRRAVESRGDSPEEAVFHRLRQSLKYRTLCEATLRRIAGEASKRFPSEKNALQWAKKKLHQSFGSFMTDGSRRRIDALISRLSGPKSASEQRELCRQILGCHVSTRERLPLLQELYPKVFEVSGKPVKIVDLGCGLHPFALPWMGLGAHVEYLAVDSECRLVDSIRAFFTAIGFSGKADCADLFSFVSEGDADLMLLLKTLPCLERQKRGAGIEIIRKLKTRRLLISFPTRTLGGRRKGLPESYRKYAEGIASELRAPVTRFEYPSELFYLFDFDGSAG